MSPQTNLLVATGSTPIQALNLTPNDEFVVTTLAESRDSDSNSDEDEEALELPSIHSSKLDPKQTIAAPPPPPPVAFENKYVSFSAICFFSIIGVMIRVSLSDLNTYEGAPLTVVEALTGSSMFAISASHFTFTNIVSAFTIIAVTIGMALSTLHFGAIIATSLTYISWLTPPTPPPQPQPQLPISSSKSFFASLSLPDCILLFLAVLASIATIAATATSVAFSNYAVASWAFACLFAPVGAVIRWQASLHLNNKTQLSSRRRRRLLLKLPLGTFLVNVVGCIVRAAVAAALVRGGMGELAIAAVSGGVGDGFTGALTTLSTFANEVNGMGLWDASVYFWASVVVGGVAVSIAYPFTV
ncbi:hypothetical protein HK100_000601 [Physocladia obscura]|uniref:Uncharacterized protein n=1 Tax=Physocladia obscura TaxID=109957 RepID=A0AAD5TAC3_9FUNG|nr:hypothetical protein HK100_000601 [Physocladia obscura]